MTSPPGEVIVVGEGRPEDQMQRLIAGWRLIAPVTTLTILNLNDEAIRETAAARCCCLRPKPLYSPGSCFLSYKTERLSGSMRKSSFLSHEALMVSP